MASKPKAAARKLSRGLLASRPAIQPRIPLSAGSSSAHNGLGLPVFVQSMRASVRAADTAMDVHAAAV